MTKEEFKNTLIVPYKGYLNTTQHTMNNSILAYCDNLNDFNNYCSENYKTFLGFCSAPYEKEIYLDAKHSIILDKAMVFEYNDTFEKEWFHMDIDGISCIVREILNIQNEQELNNLLNNLK